MQQLEIREKVLAGCLAVLAGLIDAVGFIELGGFFVSFMSGNTTRAGLGLADGSLDAIRAFGLIAIFVGGVVAGSLTGHFAGSRRAPAVLAVVFLVLLLAASARTAGLTWVTGWLLAFAMGSENAVFEKNGEVRFGLTYMTGALVKFGQRIAAAMRGGNSHGWSIYLTQWVCLATGATAGATLHPLLGSGALWLAAAVSAVLCAVSWVALPRASETR